MRTDQIKALPDGGRGQRDELASVNNHPGHRASGIYFGTPSVSVGTSTVQLTADRLYALPYYVPESRIYSGINIDVTTQASGKLLRLGIMTNLHGAPERLVWDFGEMSMTGTGVKTIKTTLRLARGWHWLRYVSDGTPTLRAIATATNCGAAMFTGVSSTSAVVTTITAYQSYTYGAMPQIHPQSAFSYDANAFPQIWITC